MVIMKNLGNPIILVAIKVLKTVLPVPTAGILRTSLLIDLNLTCLLAGVRKHPKVGS